MFDTRKDALEHIDPAIWNVICRENHRQEDHIELIASENYASPAVLAAVGSQLTNKYAEGYPGKRYYGGCEVIDEAEHLAIDRIKALFDAEAANVQPHSGSQANQAVFFAALQPGDTILGMSLAEGGHLTHGMPLNISGKWFKVASYGLTESEEIDYEKMERQAQEIKPKLIIAGASVYALRIDFERFSRVARKVRAFFMADMAHYSGLIAGGVYPNPVPHADFVTTTTHKGLRGPRGGAILMKTKHEKSINSAIFPGIQGGPLMHVIAGKAVAFKLAATPEFKQYQRHVLQNAQAMAEVFQSRGLRIVSGRTESHMMLVDLRSHDISGRDVEQALGTVCITCNKNVVPNDPRKPMAASGIRIGTPAITSRDFGLDESRLVANLVADIVLAPHDAAVRMSVLEQVRALCNRFPVYS
jgi:glycine hydroxymethyltransferase